MASKNILSSFSITILILVFSCFPCIITFQERIERLKLPPGVFGAESLAFESQEFDTEIFYTGTADGLIWKCVWSDAWLVYAFTSPNWSSTVCDGNKDPDNGPICGRPMGLGFNVRTQKLYVVDAYYGFFVADLYDGFLVENSEEKRAKLIANSAEGTPFKSPHALDIDPTTENVYFTDASAVYELRNFTQARLNKDSTGRLMKYGPVTKQISVVMRNLSGPLGVAVNANGSYLLVTESFANRVKKFWLKGPKANTTEESSSFVRMPNNIKRYHYSRYFMMAGRGETGDSMAIKFDGIDNRVESFLVYLTRFGIKTPVSEVQGTPAKLYITSPSSGIHYTGRINAIN